MSDAPKKIFRCPHCGHTPEINVDEATVCPKCGKLSTPKRLDFRTIERPLEELLISIENLIEREVIKRIPNHPDTVMYLDASFRLARNTFDSIRYLCADKAGPSGDLPRPEFCLSAAPLARTILDTIMTLIFLFEDLLPRWDWFLRTGWREMKIDYDQTVVDFGHLETWKPFLRLVESMVAAGIPALGLTQEQVNNPRKGIPKWPNPGQMPGYGDKSSQALPSRIFLKSLNHTFYADLSQQSHLSAMGVGKRGTYLLTDSGLSSDERRDNLRGYVADQIFLTVTLLLILSSVFDERFELGLDERIRPLWDTIGRYWDPAQILYQTRYDRPLFA